MTKVFLQKETSPNRTSKNNFTEQDQWQWHPSEESAALRSIACADKLLI
jgi:hypothetical protein